MRTTVLVCHAPHPDPHARRGRDLPPVHGVPCSVQVGDWEPTGVIRTMARGDGRRSMPYALILQHLPLEPDRGFAVCMTCKALTEYRRVA